MTAIPRRARRALWLALAAACLVPLAGCGSSGGSHAGGGFKVAVFSVGSRTDGSFGQAWADASANAARTTGAKVQWVGDMNTPDQYVSQGTSYAEAGYNLIVLAHGAMLPAGIQLAKRFPHTQFCVAPVPAPPPGASPKNLCIVDAKQEIGAFRAGMLAGLVTRSNVVASNQSLPVPAITRQVEAFQLGAECVNTHVRVLSVVTNDDTDPSVTRTASEAQIHRGADVLMGATGTAMAGMFDAAKQVPGTYAIGQYVVSTDAAPATVLASNIVDFQRVLPLLVAAAERGPLPAFHAYGLDSPVPVGYLAMNGPLYAKLPADVRAANARAQAALSSGKVRIPPVQQIEASGAAAKIDVASLGCRPVR